MDESLRGREKVCENLRVELSVERPNLDSTRVFSVNHPPVGIIIYNYGT